MTKRRQYVIETLLFLVIAACGFNIGRHVLLAREVEFKQQQIQTEQQVDDIFQKEKGGNPFQFGPPVTPFHPFDNDPYGLDNMFKLPTPPPSEPGSLKWYDALPLVLECTNTLDVWRQPQCHQVSNYI